MTTEPTPTITGASGGSVYATNLLPAPKKTAAQPWYDAFISRNAKALAALVIGGLAWGAVVVHSPSHAITAEEWLQLGGSVAAALGVYGATNTRN